MYNNRYRGILGITLTEGTIRIDDKLNKQIKLTEEQGKGILTKNVQR
jgi:hypothetical protein